MVRGAAIKGLEADENALVKNRKCRRFYGTAHSTRFICGVHAESKAYICPFSGKELVRDKLSWLVRKGQDLSTSETTHTKLELCHKFWVGDERKTELDLLAADSGKVIESASDYVSHLPA